MSNRLIKESSPYLQQHANNPVDWYPWGAEALLKAQQENKLIVVSIGYSACHWCHVMEHESFEDKEVADIMNKHFVCIKVDREERPDVDQVYMTAVQLMTGQGGWPLNCICLPDQRPVYGGTYFRKEDWKNLLLNLAAFWQQKPSEAVAYAEKLTNGVKEAETISFSDNTFRYSKQDLEEIFDQWKKTFDLSEGGYNPAPKFLMPNNWKFLLSYAHLMKDKDAQDFVHLTLLKMACGGIYDQIGGGFARYSVDAHWHIPHFEKMLYDNAQLISLYSEAYQYYKDPLFRDIVYQTLGWASRELSSGLGGFYSALDADSEGMEGKFYTYSRKELESLLGEDAALFCAYYGVTEQGNWAEEETNVLFRQNNEEELAGEYKLTLPELDKLISKCKDTVFRHREKRIRPGLDNKILASWNGLMLRGLTDAYRAFGDPDFLEAAVLNARFLTESMVNAGGKLKRVYKGPSADSDYSPAFLDDYAFVIDGLTSLYEVTFDESWLLHARELTEYVLKNFYDAGSGMFYFTSQGDAALIARKHEILDNVIPSSNSAMALNLYRIGHFFDLQAYIKQAEQMLADVFPQIKSYGRAHSNWAMLLFYKIFGLYEIAITGQHADAKRRMLEEHFIPNKIILGGVSGTLPLLEDKWRAGTTIFICREKTCQLPVTETEDAIKQLR